MGPKTSRAPRSMERRPSPNEAVTRIREQATSSPRTARRRRTVLESCTGWTSPKFSEPSPLSVVASVPVRAVDDLELLEGASAADRNTGQRGLGQVRRHLRLLAQALVEPLQQ